MTKRPLGRTASYRAAVYNVVTRPTCSVTWSTVLDAGEVESYTIGAIIQGSMAQMFVTVISSSIASQKNWGERLSMRIT